MTRAQKPVAVFDIDGTIFRSSLLIELVEGLILEGIFPSRAREIYEREHEHWLNRKDSYEKYIAKVVESYSTFLRGVRDERLWGVARKVMDAHQHKTYRFTRDLLKKLKKTHFLIAISGSPMDIVAPFCKEHGFDKTYGRVYEFDKQYRFTGNVMFEDLINNKDRILERAVKKENLTLKGSFGVGDSETDIPFLKMVENAIAFNPNKKLYNVAKKNKWDIVVERKDMIYKLS